MRRRLTAFCRGALFVAVLVGCKDREPPAKKTSASADAATTKPAPAALDFEPVPRRLALPVNLLDMRLEGREAGTLYDEHFPDGVSLTAVGLNQCQTGWVLQGFVRPKPGADLRATPPFQLALPTLPAGQTVQQKHPTLQGQTMVLDFDTATMRRLKGTFRVVDDPTGDEVFRMEIDTEPVGVTPAAGLGPQGCFTTGSWKMENGDSMLEGPVSAVFDGRRMHYVGLRLTEKHGIGIWMELQPQHRQPQYVLRGNLRRMLEKPKKVPFRVMFETRNQDPEFGIEVDEVHAVDGDFHASFRKANPQGPVRIQISDLKVPDEWEGPVPDAIDTVRVETLLVTDTRGTSVPIPTNAEFE